MVRKGSSWYVRSFAREYQYDLLQAPCASCPPAQFVCRSLTYMVGSGTQRVRTCERARGSRVNANTGNTRQATGYIPRDEEDLKPKHHRTGDREQAKRDQATRGNREEKSRQRTQGGHTLCIANARALQFLPRQFDTQGNTGLKPHTVWGLKGSSWGAGCERQAAEFCRGTAWRAAKPYSIVLDGSQVRRGWSVDGR